MTVRLLIATFLVTFVLGSVPSVSTATVDYIEEQNRIDRVDVLALATSTGGIVLAASERWPRAQLRGVGGLVLAGTAVVVQASSETSYAASIRLFSIVSGLISIRRAVVGSSSASLAKEDSSTLPPRRIQLLAGPSAIGIKIGF